MHIDSCSKATAKQGNGTIEQQGDVSILVRYCLSGNASHEYQQDVWWSK